MPMLNKNSEAIDSFGFFIYFRLFFMIKEIIFCCSYVFELL